MLIASKDLGLDILKVVVPSGPRYFLKETIEVLALGDLIQDLIGRTFT
ncbi:MAG: hypothetical protein WCQ50_01210 [Spirochaetota bacterium]